MNSRLNQALLWYKYSPVCIYINARTYLIKTHEIFIALLWEIQIKTIQLSENQEKHTYDFIRHY